MIKISLSIIPRLTRVSEYDIPTFRLHVINPGSSNLYISFQLYRGVGEDKFALFHILKIIIRHYMYSDSNKNFNYLTKPDVFNVNVLKNRLHLTTTDDSLSSDLGKHFKGIEEET